VVQFRVGIGVINMAENTQEVNPFEQKLKPLLREGEQFVTNAPKKVKD